MEKRPVVLDHVAGLAEVIYPPPKSTATHKLADGHDTPTMALASAEYTCQADAPPVGLVVVSIPPTASPATHRVVVGHDSDSMSLEPSVAVPAIFASVQVEAPPVGLVEVKTLP